MRHTEFFLTVCKVCGAKVHGERKLWDDENGKNVRIFGCCSKCGSNFYEHRIRPLTPDTE